MVTELMVTDDPRSTCHHALSSRFVCVTDKSKNWPSVLPSTALAATALGYPAYVLL